MRLLVEGFSTDAIAVARVLAEEGAGASVLLAGPGEAPAGAVALRGLGVELAAGVDLDAAVPGVDVAFLDVWTPPVAPRVGRLRAAGARIASIGDLVLERAAAPVIGVTGTAGKTTTAGLVAHLLGAAGLDVVASDASASGNRWPDATLLGAAATMPPGGRLVVELTSSHLAFMSRSPALAVVTTFWPDHLELHGSLTAYREAKEGIVRHQGHGDVVVVDVAAPEVAWFAGRTPARRVGFARGPHGDAGAWIEDDAVVLRDGAGGLLRAPLPAADAFRGERSVNAAAACAAALAAGASAAAVAEALPAAPAPPYRLRDLGRVGGARIVDDGMAATPAKARATLAGFADRTVVLVCGGDDAPAGRAVHASPEERRALDRACDEAARAASAVVAFGPAGDRLSALLARRGTAVTRVATLDEAVAAGLERAGGVGTLVLAPMFPMPATERARLAAIVAAHRG